MNGYGFGMHYFLYCREVKALFVSVSGNDNEKEKVKVKVKGGCKRSRSPDESQPQHQLPHFVARFPSDNDFDFNVRVLGTVAEIINDDSSTVLVIDDGTGVITVRRCNNKSKGEEIDCEVRKGDEVAITGKLVLSSSRKKPSSSNFFSILDVTSIEVDKDPNCTLYWAQTVENLYRECYFSSDWTPPEGFGNSDDGDWTAALDLWKNKNNGVADDNDGTLPDEELDCEDNERNKNRVKGVCDDAVGRQDGVYESVHIAVEASRESGGISRSELAGKVSAITSRVDEVLLELQENGLVYIVDEKYLPL